MRNYRKSVAVLLVVAVSASPMLHASDSTAGSASTEVATDVDLASPARVDAAEQSAGDLAKKLANPIANLISVPIQSNMDFGAGPDKGIIWRTNIQPVIPVDLNENWTLITRTILPVVYQEGLIKGGAADAAGLGDMVQSFFLSPKESPITWGVGPVLLWPTATDDLLGSGQFGAGPTVVLLKQTGAWTVGLLANQIWGFGAPGRESTSALFLQPFVSYITPTQTTLSINTEASYDWKASQWNVPLNFQVAQLMKVGGVPLQVFLGVRAYPEKPEYGPDWGIRFGVTLLFPKG